MAKEIKISKEVLAYLLRNDVKDGNQTRNWIELIEASQRTEVTIARLLGLYVPPTINPTAKSEKGRVLTFNKYSENYDSVNYTLPEIQLAKGGKMKQGDCDLEQWQSGTVKIWDEPEYVKEEKKEEKEEGFEAELGNTFNHVQEPF